MVAEGEFHHKEKVREVAMCSYQRFSFGKMNIYMIYITCTSSQNELTRQRPLFDAFSTFPCT